MSASRDSLMVAAGVALAVYLWNRASNSANDLLNQVAQSVTGDPTQSPGGIVWDLLHPTTGIPDLINHGVMATPQNVIEARLYIVDHPSQFGDASVELARQQLVAAGIIDDNYGMGVGYGAY